jgi:hypothetical protein
LGGPLIGFIAERKSLDHALAVFGIILAAGSAAARIFMFRHHQFTDHDFTDDPVSGSEP